ncbi:MAG: hypothetical protein WC393_01190 [Candidatus Nanoarchaeia archaeon]|jgi:hypothetical protein
MEACIKAKEIAKYFKLNSAEDLINRMPELIIHDFDSAGNRRKDSLTYIIKPSSTINYIYSKLPKNASELYTPAVLTCLQQARFAADMINYCLKEESDSPAKVVEGYFINIKKMNWSKKGEFIKENGKILRGGHEMVLFKEKLMDSSNNSEKIYGREIISPLSIPYKITESRGFYEDKGAYVNLIGKNNEVFEHDVDKDWEKWGHLSNQDLEKAIESANLAEEKEFLSKIKPKK